jgi:hypothetical protein
MPGEREPHRKMTADGAGALKMHIRMGWMFLLEHFLADLNRRGFPRD